MQIEEILINSEYYPERLKYIDTPPLKLYILGNKQILNRRGVAIVGTRKCTKYGEKCAFEFSKELTLKGFNIISGLALGIDTCAHLGNVQTIENQVISKKDFIGNTIAILGCGIDKLYPKENRDLAKRILNSGGCIISEYPNGTPPKRENFPQRNRIISGMSDKILVVEAGERSGAIITANFALEQGKDVYAIPGNINNAQSFGTNKLIADGAIITTCIDDILFSF